MKLSTWMKPGTWPAASWAMVRRELWEHTAIVRLPAILGALMILALIGLMALPSRISGHLDEADKSFRLPLSEITNDASAPDLKFSVDEFGLGTLYDVAEQIPADIRGAGISLMLLGLYGSYDLFLKILMGVYLAGCLFRERRDNSVLFWKSLPVSDTNTVLVKAALGMVGIPLIFFAVSLLTMFVSQLFVGFGALFTGHSMGLAFECVMYGTVLRHMWTSMISQILWLAPIGGYFLLMSAWAKRNVALWIIGPPLAIITLEGYFMAKGRFAIWLGKHFVHLPNLEDQMHNLEHAGPMEVLNFNFSTGFDKPDMWLGVLIFAAFVSGAIWIRRWREESA